MTFRKRMNNNAPWQVVHPPATTDRSKREEEKMGRSSGKSNGDRNL
jgi:hypothetical protein